VKAPEKSRYQGIVTKRPVDESDQEEEGEDDDTLSSVSEELEDEDDVESVEGSDSEDSTASEPESDNEAVLAKIQQTLSGTDDKPNKKRKRGGKDNDVENEYMEKIAREEAKDEEKRIKKQKIKPVEDRKTKETEKGAASDAEDSDEETFTIPKHETLMESPGNDEQELEKAARTVFLGNVSSEAITSKSAQKQLKHHLASFIPDLADNKPPHKIESIRFRSSAFSNSLPKRAAYAKKEIMDTTTKSTNAYVVYSTKIAAREAAKRLNGTIVLGRHLRVDSVAHPAKVDHRRCVFIGNLGFVDDESNVNAEDGKKKSSKPPGDVEEGLWVQFSKAGKVESVRVPRDPLTRVGKGFAYIQFDDENAVEAALQFNEQKYPPMLPRKLRVTRARAQKKNHKKAAQTTRSEAPKPKGAYNAKISGEQKSSQGRVRAVLGKAAAFKSAESFVFEGHRASSKQGTSGLKLGGKNKSAKGPNGRKSRSKAWKASSGGPKK
jgi:nucleolar protein 12